MPDGAWVLMIVRFTIWWLLSSEIKIGLDDDHRDYWTGLGEVYVYAMIRLRIFNFDLWFWGIVERRIDDKR